MKAKEEVFNQATDKEPGHKLLSWDSEHYADKWIDIYTDRWMEGPPFILGSSVANSVIMKVVNLMMLNMLN